jgi:hypothetical protein
MSADVDPPCDTVFRGEDTRAQSKSPKARANRSRESYLQERPIWCCFLLTD